jgi:hypothetical protein
MQGNGNTVLDGNATFQRHSSVDANALCMQGFTSNLIFMQRTPLLSGVRSVNQQSQFHGSHVSQLTNDFRQSLYVFFILSAGGFFICHT